MIEAVLIFALITSAFEFAVLAHMAPRTRLRALGKPGTIAAVAFALNLVVHWGTITGSMTAVTAGLASMLATSFARKYWGYIEQGRFYKVGIVKFDPSVLK